MKTRYIISVKQDQLKEVVKALNRKGIDDMEVLEVIGVIVISPKKLTISEIKEIEGVENVEKEGKVNL